MIPKGGEYLKLSIKPTYTVSRNNILPSVSGMIGPSRSLGDRLKAVAGIADFKVAIAIESQLLPIWPIAGNVEVLGKHFPWLRQLSQELTDLYKPDGGQFLENCTHFQQALIKRGWAFAVQIRSAICFAGDRQAAEALRGELNGRGQSSQPDMALDFHNAETFVTYKADGTKLSSVPIRELGLQPQKSEKDDELDNVEDAGLAKRLVNQQKKQDFAGWINGLFRQGDLSVLDFCNLPPSEFGSKGHVFWDSLQGWHGINPKAVQAVFSRKNFEQRSQQFPRIASILSNEIDQALSGAIAYAKLSGFDIGWGDSLTEATFRQLLQDTRSNGKYKFGGMRLIQGRWVYDMAVPGRTENARFVFTRRPVLTIDQDGLPMYSFSFLSRWNRNTTGMRHTGYVKFIKPKSGMLARIKRYLFLDQMDLDVHVKCTCPDFKYRWHKALADAGAAQTPTGIGGEATNVDPHQTNPGKLRSLCKHLVCMGGYLKSSARDHDKMVKALADPRFEAKGEGEAKAVKPNAKLMPTMPL